VSEEATNSAQPTCEQLLDYVYGELGEADKAAFEAHLPTCPRCQAEVTSLGRTRQAARRLMPTVEAPANLTGPLHAQLMHAASQRRPKRGVVLIFRRVAQHPQLAAAAMFLVVGGAFVLSWHKGKLFPPAAPSLTTPVPEVSKAAEPSPSFDKLAAKPPDGTKELELPREVAKPNDTDSIKLDAKDKQTTDDLVLRTSTGSYEVTRGPRHHAASPGTRLAPKKKSASAKDYSGDDMKMLQPNFDSSGSVGGSVGGVSGAGRGELAKATAPTIPTEAEAPPPPPSSRAKPQVMNSELQQQVAPSAAPQPVAVARDADSAYKKREKAAVMKPSAATAAVNLETQRRRFDELAKSNRCDEAIKQFQELERTTMQTISPNERALYVRCLMQMGRQQEAEQQLLELKADKKLSNADTQKLQEELDGNRYKYQRASQPSQPSKKAKTAPTSVESRNAAPPASPPPPQAQQLAPVQASPPPAAAPAPKADHDSARKAPAF
jgi:hypothetical protein